MTSVGDTVASAGLVVEMEKMVGRGREVRRG